jgi:hypothetical protein
LKDFMGLLMHDLLGKWSSGMIPERWLSLVDFLENLESRTKALEKKVKWFDSGTGTGTWAESKVEYRPVYHLRNMIANKTSQVQINRCASCKYLEWKDSTYFCYRFSEGKEWTPVELELPSCLRYEELVSE